MAKIVTGRRGGCNCNGPVVDNFFGSMNGLYSPDRGSCIKKEIEDNEDLCDEYGCPIILAGRCVKFSGSPYPEAGIDAGMSMDDVMRSTFMYIRELQVLVEKYRNEVERLILSSGNGATVPSRSSGIPSKEEEVY